MRLVEMITTFVHTPSDVNAFYEELTTNVYDLSTNKFRSTVQFNQRDSFNAYVDAGDIESVAIEKIESNTKVKITVNWYSSASWLEYMKGDDQWYSNFSDGTFTSLIHMYLNARIDNALVVDYDHQNTEPALSHYNNMMDWISAQKQMHLDVGMTEAFSHIQTVLYDDKHPNFSIPSSGWAREDLVV
jgi:hypothetical protein